jgi:ParB family chromosome partitioning protein
VIAGQRRFNACRKIAESQSVEPLPCAIMEEGDDEKAIEASLAENIARLPMDEIDQYEAFQNLSRCGQSVDDIASHFGVTPRLVQQRLAIANLYEPILNAYRREDIQASTIRLLTLATKTQQKAWFKLFKSEDDYAPTGHHLKNWLFGGDQIPTTSALFDVEAFKGTLVSDLFGEEAYFSDSSLFWEEQSKAIALMMEDYREEGWSDVILLDVGDYFASWDYVATPKEDGGKVYIHVATNGEVTPHEGKLSSADVKKREKEQQVENGEALNERPELTAAMQNYLGLHRHSAVRAKLLEQQGIALRLCVAQIIAGSSLFEAKADPQKANTDAIGESLATNKAEAVFAKERSEIYKLLGLSEDEIQSVVPLKGDWMASRDLQAIFTTLLKLDDASVMRILTFVIAETLASQSDTVEMLGAQLSVNMNEVWTPDQTFFDLFRDKQAINAMVKEVAGKNAAESNITATAKVQKGIIQDCINGKRKMKQKNWKPRYMQFPMKGYTKREKTISFVQFD